LAAIEEEEQDYARIKKDLDAEVAKAHERAARRKEKAKAKRDQASKAADEAISAA